MPVLRWKASAEVEPDYDCIVFATFLPLSSHRHLPSMLRHTWAITRQLGGSDDLVGYSLEAHLLAKEFWTVSAWRERSALAAFAHSEPHATAMSAIRPYMQTPTFVSWTCPGRALPIAWSEVRERVEAERGSRGDHPS